MINTQQIQLNLTKTQLSNILSDLLMSEDNAALIRAINPVLADKFPQFPEFTNINLTEVHDDGTGTVTLRVPPAAKSKPDEVETTEEEPAEAEVESEPTEA